MRPFAWETSKNGPVAHIDVAFRSGDIVCSGAQDALTVGSTLIVNPMGSKNGATKVVRGGSCRNEIRYLRVSNRGGFYPEQHYDSLGFRLVRTSGF